MTNDIDSVNPAASTTTWQLNALTAALGDLTLTVDDSLSVGRGNDNDVVLGSKQVSRNHAVLSVLDGQLYVKDLDSSNGTFINDRRIEGNESNLLQVDDTLGFASFAFQVHTSVANEVEMPIATADESVAAIVPSTVASTESAEIFDEPVTAEETDINEAITENAIMEDAVVEEKIVADDFVEDMTAEEPVVEDAITKDTVVEQPIVEEPVLTSSEPIVKETGIEDILPTTDTSDNVSSETDLETETDAPDISTTATTDVIDPVSQEAPIFKETGIDTVLSATDSVEPSPIEETPVVAETVSNQPEVMAAEPTISADNEPLVAQPAVDEEPAVQVSHDKTTTTELQEEADPDVLRAKQAATSQFSGTANLGQSHDLGTQGNNAADQQISNPANAGHIEKKPSGGWFIWVFAAILIIGLALWLFNKGIV
ncbi:FHA domain-containing protein [Psychrobacter sp. NG27]|uniref:FHA domain-containing protein n=1 Tax=Psychrobacter sp. NG27 TaxID=2781966 RepID=UPI0018E0248A|nr:FHA domain-containing protein [Psychrobacter sp. NG27]MBI0426179.1 FHA domain-containing protein [Psychrobacter sp. NG27]